jgi:outer membrane biosynthesis protein TonB
MRLTVNGAAHDLEAEVGRTLAETLRALDAYPSRMSEIEPQQPEVPQPAVVPEPTPVPHEPIEPAVVPEPVPPPDEGDRPVRPDVPEPTPQ